MPTLLGLKSCDTCRKAARALAEAGHDVDFRDVRETPLSEDEIGKYLELFGSPLLNTRSTTWRTLSEEERKAPAEHLLKTHPTLMKRPVIQTEDAAYLGWTKDVQGQLLGN